MELTSNNEVAETRGEEINAIVLARRTDKVFADAKLSAYYQSIFKEYPKCQVIAISKELENNYSGINIRVSAKATTLKAVMACEKCEPNGSTTLLRQPTRKGIVDINDVTVETRDAHLELIARIASWM